MTGIDKVTFFRREHFTHEAATIRHIKRLYRFHLRGRVKVNTQWHLYCLVHNIEKLAKACIGVNRNR